MTKFFAVILIALTFNVHSEINKEKKQNIETLLEMTGALKIGNMFAQAIVSQMCQILKNGGTVLPDSVITILEEEVKIIIDEQMKLKSGLIDQLCLLYDKYYSDSDIKGLISFYKTELGQKVISTLPSLTQESLIIGQKWGESQGQIIGEKLEKRLKKKGYKFK
ncbi:MAG: DUF2059 domain-containing protein [Actinobacteria bacterium]|nr:DUF2059 domain-containing protein [Actinomycetota bacterium]